ncbi:MAG: hypothetical protein ACPLQP_00220 [Moorellaceae bacterium]
MPQHEQQPKLPPTRTIVDNYLEVSNPGEVEKMIGNLELVLEEMQQEAWLKGLEEEKHLGVSREPHWRPELPPPSPLQP